MGSMGEGEKRSNLEKLTQRLRDEETKGLRDCKTARLHDYFSILLTIKSKISCC